MGLFSKKTKIPATGFYAMPPQYQALYNNILGQIGEVALPGGKVNTQAFTPLPITSAEQKSLAALERGVTPDAEQLAADIALQTNPFDSYVLDEINRQATGQASLLNTGLAGAGQFGSNRGLLGANDLEQTRLRTIGGFKQDQYNRALENALRVMPALRVQDIQGGLLSGEFLRGMDTATKQAPFAALGAAQSSLGAVPTSFGDFGSPERTVKTGGGIGGLISGISGIASGLAGIPGIGSLASFAGGFPGFGSVSQGIGSLFDRSPMGPYRPFGLGY